MSPERYARLKSIVLAAAARPESEVQTYLDDACSGDASLRAEAEELLMCRERAAVMIPTGALDRDAARAFQDDAPSFVPEATVESGCTAGQSFGPYRLIQKVGEGGMGEVWLAEQSEPIRRKVALKVIKAGMDSRSVVARFEAERQALALMEHPTIARVFDAGTTPRGLPYFAMEYIEGTPMTDFCDSRGLAIPERLDLFIQVCEAVQHAHQKGIIHRDLKPSNMLVTDYGEGPVPRIIDFGVAKATAQRLTEKTLFTGLGVLIGTPEYMSPEQAELTGLDVDTRTDVYALGVTLYELLTGSLPLSREDCRSAGFDEIRRRIREVDPPRPSSKVKSQGDASAESARRRHTEPAKLVHRLEGDLDWITMKALEKDRTRRYGSAADLALDIRRCLADQPVLAGPPTLPYIAGKFVRRHRLGVLAVGAAGIALLLGMAGTTAGLIRARRAEREARHEAQTSDRVAGFLSGMLRDMDPERMGKLLVRDLGERATGYGIDRRTADQVSGMPGTDTARRLLDEEILARAALSIDKEFGKDPLIAARLHHTLARVYSQLGLPDAAETPERSALEARERLLGPTDPATLDSMLVLEWILCQQARFPEAEALGRRALEISNRARGEESPITPRAMSSLAWVYRAEGMYVESEDLYRRALALDQRIFGPEDQTTLAVMNDLGYVLLVWGRDADAERLHRQVLEIRMRRFGPEHHDTLWSLYNVAWAAENRGDLAEASRLFEQCLETRRRILGTEHPDTLEALRRLAGVRLKQRRFAEAERLQHQALEAQRRLLGPKHQNTLWTLRIGAEIEYWQGRLAESRRDGEELLSSWRRSLGDGHVDTSSALAQLRRTCWAGGWMDEIRRLDREMLAGLCQAAERPEPTWRVLTECAFALLDDEHPAREAAQEALRHAERAVQMSQSKDSMPLAALALAYDALGDSSHAVETQKKAIGNLEPPEGRRRAYMESQLARYEAHQSRLAGPPAALARQDLRR